MSILVDLPIVPLTFAHLVVCILPSYSAHGRHWCAPSDTCWSFAGIVVGPEREMAADSSCLVPASSLTPPRPHTHFPPHQFAHNLLHHLLCAIPLWIAKYQITIIAIQCIASCPLFVLRTFHRFCVIQNGVLHILVKRDLYLTNIALWGSCNGKLEIGNFHF